MPGDEQQEPPPLAFPPRARPAAASLGLMQLTLATEDLCASRGPEDAQKKRARTRSKHATAALVDELPSPVSSASSKDYATGKRRGFSAPSLKRSVTAVARMTDRLPSIPSLSRSVSTEAQVEPAASAAAPVLQRAKTESEGASSSRTIAMVTLQSTTAGRSQAATRTGRFSSLKRSERASKAGDHGAEPDDTPEERLCPLDSPVGAAPPAGSMSFEAPSKPDEAEEVDVKAKRRFAPSIPSLMRTSSKDNAKPPPAPEPPTQELPPPVTIAVSPPTHEGKAASHSPKEPAAKETPKRTKRKFVMPSLRRSSTSSSEKSVSSFVVPSSDAAASSNPPGSSSDESTMESPLEEDDDAEQEGDDGASKPQKFGIPALFRSLTGTSNMKRKGSDSKMEDRKAADNAMASPGRESSARATTTQTQPPSPVASAKSRKSMLPPVPSSTKAAARFFSGMKPRFQRSVSTAKGNGDKPGPASPKKAKTPSTAEEDLSDTNASDEEEEKEMRSLLSMLQVPRGRRESTAPLMSTGEEEVSF